MGRNPFLVFLRRLGNMRLENERRFPPEEKAASGQGHVEDERVGNM